MVSELDMSGVALRKRLAVACAQSRRHADGHRAWCQLTRTKGRVRIRVNAPETTNIDAGAMPAHDGNTTGPGWAAWAAVAAILGR